MTYFVKEPLLSGWGCHPIRHSGRRATGRSERLMPDHPFAFRKKMGGQTATHHLTELLRSGQCEVHCNVGINFHRLPVQHIGLVLPLLHGFDSRR